jgi:ribosomal protein S18 acetylase RimI-like enzyme
MTRGTADPDAGQPVDDVALETVAARWWPAAETARDGPWLLRFADGFTGRANSVAPLGPVPIGDLPSRIAAAEAFYRDRGLPPRFQVPDTPRTAPLREALTAHGYRAERGYGHVHVMVRDRLDVAPPAVAITRGDDPDDPWVERWWAVSPRGNLLDAGRALLERVPRPRTFARCGGGAVPDAVGMAAVVDGWVGLGAIAVAAGARRRGLGRAITVALLAWGGQHGAGRAFLQVSSDNAPGIALYASLGFRTAYDYRYWS